MAVGTAWLITIATAPVAGAIILCLMSWLGRRSDCSVERVGRVAGWVALATASLSLIGAIALLAPMNRGGDPEISLAWIPAAHIRLALHLDWLALPFLMTEAAVTVVAVVYAWGYHRSEARTPLFYALLLLFAAGMSGTTLAGDMFLFYVYWELMLIASCLLIAVWGDGQRREAVALKYFIFTHLGSLLVLAGLLILYDNTGSDSFAALRQADILAPRVISLVISLFTIGFCVKMAIFPLHLWLPDAHSVAPMPVTIMLAAAMLSMGAYGILRFPLSIFSPEQIAPFATPWMVAGVVSAIYGALMALAEQDIKRIIAYSSVSQMGYILYGLGTLNHDGITGATEHVVFHGIVKALLFIGVGNVIRATGRRQLAELGGLARTMPLVAVCTGLGALAIAGVPPLAIFDSEWMIFSGGFHTAQLGLAVLALLGSLATAAYALWFTWRVFLGTQPESLTADPLPWTMVVPGIVLSVLTIIAGILPGAVFNWAEHALDTILGGGW